MRTRLPAAAGAAGVKPRIILRRGNGPEPESLDLHRARSEAALTILRDLHEGLTSIAADGTPVPAAADRCDISADGRIHRFHLRPGARWSNGDAVVADDFVAAWRRLMDPHTGAQYADILGAVRGASDIMAGSAAPSSLGVRADDAHSLVVELARPTPYFLCVMAHPATFPIHRGSLAEHRRGFAKPGTMVSNGAFVLTRWDFGSHLVAARNRLYWNDGATQLDGVEYYSFADGATELRAFRTGQLDVTATFLPHKSGGSGTTWGARCRSRPSSPCTTWVSISASRPLENPANCARRCRWCSTASGSCSPSPEQVKRPPTPSCHRKRTATRRRCRSTPRGRCRSGSHERGSCCAMRVSTASRPPSNCATTTGNRTIASPLRLGRCGRRRWASMPAARGRVQSAVAGHQSRRGFRLFRPAGSATTTTRTGFYRS